MRAFRSGEVWILICTQVLGRGIDFIGVNLVINFDFPQSAVSYIHAIGSTVFHAYFRIYTDCLNEFMYTCIHLQAGPVARDERAKPSLSSHSGTCHIYERKKCACDVFAIHQFYCVFSQLFLWILIFRIADVMRNAGCEVPEYMLKMAPPNE